MNRIEKIQKQEVFKLSYKDMQPSQLYISKEKLNRIYDWLSEDNSYTYDPIPVKEINNQMIMVDGHTRVFALYLLGFDEIEVILEPVEWDWEAYEICIDWCKDESIRDISDLKNRVVEDEDYELLWHERCRIMQNDLEMKRLK